MDLNAHLDSLTPSRAQEEWDEFNAVIPDWEKREYDAIAWDEGIYLSDYDFTPITNAWVVPDVDWDYYLSVTYVDPAERVL